MHEITDLTELPCSLCSLAEPVSPPGITKEHCSLPRVIILKILKFKSEWSQSFLDQEYLIGGSAIMTEIFCV